MSGDASEHNLSNIEILIIEDEPQLRILFQDLLSNWGLKSRVAANGIEGLRMMQERPSQLVLTDLNMPSMDGLEVLRQVKKFWPDTEVIVVTGYATIENAIHAMKQGAAEFITKPVNFEQLKVVINKSITTIRNYERDAELRRSYDSLIQLNQMKDRFINITNHEMRTPLTIIKGYLEIIKLPENTDKNTIESLETVKKAVKDLIYTVNHMHDLAFMDKGKAQFYDYFSVSTLFGELVKEIVVLYNKRGVLLEAKIPESEVLIFGDRNLIKRALRELLHNALKYTPEGKNVRLFVASDELNKTMITVEDEGIGIPHGDQELIFNRFYEAKATEHHFTSNEDFMGGGLGIGLNIVKEIIESHKGSIFLESEPEKGSKFTIMLPK
jgi:two-component system sensor histidine kinase/response regulator